MLNSFCRSPQFETILRIAQELAGHYVAARTITPCQSTGMPLPIETPALLDAGRRLGEAIGALTTEHRVQLYGLMLLGRGEFGVLRDAVRYAGEIDLVAMMTRQGPALANFLQEGLDRYRLEEAEIY